MSDNATTGRLFTVFLASLLVASFSCAPPAPPDSVFDRAPTVSELGGPWVTSYDTKVIEDKGSGKQYQISALETIVLKMDGTYEQTFTEAETHRLRSNSGQWTVRLGTEGKAFVALSNMRYYLDGIEYAEAHPHDVDLIIQGSLSSLSRLSLCDPYVDLNFCYQRAQF